MNVEKIKDMWRFKKCETKYNEKLYKSFTFYFYILGKLS